MRTQPPIQPGSLAVILGYFDPRDAPALVDALSRTSLAGAAEVFIGTYGPNRAVSELVHSLPQGRYAPMFSIQPKTSRGAYAGRHRSLVDKEGLLGRKYAGPIPLLETGKPLPSRDHYNWGLELGRRFRDILRSERERIGSDHWQFDEILSEVVSGTHQREHLRYVTGILNGLLVGRPRLGDSAEPGIVWCSWSATRRLPTLPINPVLQRFWEQLDKSAFLFVGQEYPRFVADPRQQARLYASGQRDLASSSGKIRRSMAERYVSGFTPGVDTKDASLGGRAPGQTLEQTRKWRSDFIDERARQRPIGVGEYAFVRENRDPGVIADVIRALDRAAVHFRA